jgi:hypothetical protein
MDEHLVINYYNIIILDCNNHVYLGEIMNQWVNMFILIQRIVVLLLKTLFHRKGFLPKYFVIIIFSYYNLSNISHVFC